MARLLGIASGMLVWAAQFTVVYGVTAIACARGYGDRDLFGMALVPLVIAAATVAALVLVGSILVQSWRRQRALAAAGAVSTERFMASSISLLGLLSLIAIAWTGLPALMFSGCE